MKQGSPVPEMVSGFLRLLGSVKIVSMKISAQEVVTHAVRRMGLRSVPLDPAGEPWVAPWSTVLFDQGVENLTMTNALISVPGSCPAGLKMTFTAPQIEEIVPDVFDEEPVEVSDEAVYGEPEPTPETGEEEPEEEVQEAVVVPESEPVEPPVKKSNPRKRGAGLKLNLSKSALSAETSRGSGAPQRGAGKKKSPGGSARPAKGGMKINTTPATALSPEKQRDNVLNYMLDHGPKDYTTLFAEASRLGFRSKKDFDECLEKMVKSGYLFKKNNLYTA